MRSLFMQQSSYTLESTQSPKELSHLHAQSPDVNTAAQYSQCEKLYLLQGSVPQTEAHFQQRTNRKNLTFLSLRGE